MDLLIHRISSTLEYLGKKFMDFLADFKGIEEFLKIFEVFLSFKFDGFVFGGDRAINRFKKSQKNQLLPHLPILCKHRLHNFTAPLYIFSS